MLGGFVQRYAVLIMLGAIGFLGLGGCDNSPPPNRVPVPTTANPDQMRPADYVKPMPPEDNRVDLRVPNQQIPEPPPSSAAPVPNASTPPPPEHSFADTQRDFLDAYKQVGQPKIVIFVNHTLQGQLVQPSAPEPWLASEPPAPQPTPSLRPDQYDQASAGAVDYAAIENRLADWLGNNGKVAVTPPATVRQKLSDDQIKQLQTGHADAAAALDADILIQVQAHPTQQTQRGLQLQLEVHAMNVKGGQAIAHATVDMEAPLDQAQIDGTTRTISRELMVDMIRTWTAPLPGDSGQTAPPASANPRP
jgi:hypothetical protein